MNHSDPLVFAWIVSGVLVVVFAIFAFATEIRLVKLGVWLALLDIVLVVMPPVNSFPDPVAGLAVAILLVTNILPFTMLVTAMFVIDLLRDWMRKKNGTS
jgi:hypothetical protein